MYRGLRTLLRLVCSAEAWRGYNGVLAELKCNSSIVWIKTDIYPFQFNKQFSFRKRHESGQNDPSEDSRDQALQPGNSSASSRDRSPGGRSQYTTSNSISRQFTSPQDVNSQGGEDPLGLKVIHRPPGDRRVDIVFVHGLGGSSRMTWSKNRNLDFFWPLKFLPFEQDINEARISTFGYNANFRPGSGKNKMSVLDFAKELLYDLKYATDDSAPEIEDLSMGEASITILVFIRGLANKKIAPDYIYCPFYGGSHCKRGIPTVCFQARQLLIYAGLSYRHICKAKMIPFTKALSNRSRQ
jgi:hypothetical protein